MKIAIFGLNSPKNYSGGRYHAWTMAEAIAAAGHDVTYVTNSKPAFYDDFTPFPAHTAVKLCISPHFTGKLPDNAFDLVFVIPHSSQWLGFYIKAHLFADRAGARLCMLNFESPNWFNSMSPVKRPESLWNGFHYIAQHASLILSSAEESDKFARDCYRPAQGDEVFASCYPSINNIAADAVPDTDREKRILLITRFADAAHKGADNIERILCEAMRGYTLALLVGTDLIPEQILDGIRAKADEFGIAVTPLYRMSDENKFRELKKSALVLFPSMFEGFGLPPVEALHSGTPCIAFDLPVLREVCGDGPIFVPAGDWPAFTNAIGKQLSGSIESKRLRAGIKDISVFDRYVERLNRILIAASERSAPARLTGGQRAILHLRAAGNDVGGGLSFCIHLATQAVSMLCPWCRKP